MPNFMCGAVVTMASWRSSTVLMKWAWPRMKFMSSGLSMGTTLMSMMASLSSEIDQGQDVGDHGRLGGAFDLHRVLDCDQDPAEAPLLDLLQHGPVADPRAGPDGVGEADPVEAVVDGHPEPAGEDLVREVEERDERKQQEAVGDRPAEGAAGRPFRVDVDPLAVLGRGGE